MRHNRRDDGQLSCRKREMKTMNGNTALDGHITVIKMAERGGVPLKSDDPYFCSKSCIRTSRTAPSLLLFQKGWLAFHNSSSNEAD